MAAVCEICKKEGANRPGLDPNNIEYGHDVMVSLEIAAADGHPDCLQVIINSGTDVNYINKENGYTLVMWAARYGHPECMEVLIKAGADVNKTECGASALMFASGYQGNVRCIELLLEAGADVNHKTRQGGTALMDAVGCGHPDVVKLLIKAGADVNAADEDDVTALIRGANSPVGWKCIELLVEAGADVNKKCDGKTPLMWTLEDGYEKCTEAVIKAGADLNMVEDEHGWTALGIAAGRDGKCFEILLEAGADVNLNNTWTACLDPWSYERVEKVIGAGADVNVEMPGPDYRTALFVAAVGNSLETIRLLFRSGMKINKLNEEGDNALEVYLSYNHQFLEKEVCMLLFAAGESVTKVTILFSFPLFCVNINNSMKYITTVSCSYRRRL